MRLDVSMTAEKDEFNVSSWWAKSPDFVIQTLERQLKAAAVIWPELSAFKLVGHVPGARGGKLGGHARAAALSPERRVEIARAAAATRWKGKPMDETTA